MQNPKRQPRAGSGSNKPPRPFAHAAQQNFCQAAGTVVPAMKCCVFCRSSPQPVTVQSLCASALLDCTQAQVRQCSLQPCASLDPSCSHLWIPCPPPAAPPPLNPLERLCAGDPDNSVSMQMLPADCLAIWAMTCCGMLLPALQVQASALDRCALPNTDLRSFPVQYTLIDVLSIP
jgi:hypothetical protein